MVGRGTGKRRREYYFDRGITVCDEWKDVNNFFEWALSNGYQENLEIDRIDKPQAPNAIGRKEFLRESILLYPKFKSNIKLP